MKRMTTNKLLVTLTFVFLVLLLVVQMVWTSHAALLEERIFNDRVEMAIVSARDELESDTLASENVKGCMMYASCNEAMRKSKLAMVDQLLRNKLNSYNIRLDYEFDLINNDEAERLKTELASSQCYITQMQKILVEKGIQLKLKFPSRDYFLLSQIFGMFLLSALLIIAVSVSFIFMLRLYAREQQLAERTKDFVNNMTHELKTPLANIGLANNLISKQTAALNNEKIVRYTQIIDTEKAKLHALAEEILTIAVLENKKTCNGLSTIDFHQIILSAAQASNLMVNERKGTIELELKASETLMKGNAERLTNVMTNLLDNGMKYNTNDPQLKISTKNFGNKLLVWVKDNGIGVEAKDLKCIFDKYYRVSTGNVHNAKGFGLGLTFVKMVIEEHGGKISMRSKPGTGSVVEIELPTLTVEEIQQLATPQSS